MESVSSTPQEPRKYFLTLLIKKVFEIYDTLYKPMVSRQSMTAVQAMIGIIDILDKQSKRDLASLRTELCHILDGGITVQERDEIKQKFDQLCNYLHDGYFKEFNFATPRSTATRRLTTDVET